MYDGLVFTDDFVASVLDTLLDFVCECFEEGRHGGREQRAQSIIDASSVSNHHPHDPNLVTQP
jgi:hypothetical protein